jgi:hypothetical protein
MDQADQQAADLRQGVADHARVAGADPPFWAWARLAASQARASMDKVMWAYQARQDRIICPCVARRPGSWFRLGPSLGFSPDLDRLVCAEEF